MKLLDVKIGDTVYISKAPIGFTRRTWLGRSPLDDAGVLSGYINDFEHYLKIRAGNPIIPVTVQDVFDIGKCKFVKIKDYALYIDSNIIAWADVYIYKWETISKIRGLDLQEAINLEKELSKYKVSETDTILGYKSIFKNPSVFLTGDREYAELFIRKQLEWMKKDVFWLIQPRNSVEEYSEFWSIYSDLYNVTC